MPKKKPQWDARDMFWPQTPYSPYAFRASLQVLFRTFKQWPIDLEETCEIDRITVESHAPSIILLNLLHDLDLEIGAEIDRSPTPDPFFNPRTTMPYWANPNFRGSDGQRYKGVDFHLAGARLIRDGLVEFCRSDGDWRFYKVSERGRRVMWMYHLSTPDWWLYDWVKSEIRLWRATGRFYGSPKPGEKGS